MTRYEDLDEESKRLLDIPDQDWQDWMDALDGDEEKGRDVKEFLSKRMGSGRDVRRDSDDVEEDEEFDTISGGRVRGRDSPIELPPVTRRGADKKVGKEASLASSSSSAGRSAASLKTGRADGRGQQNDVMATDIEKMKSMIGLKGDTSNSSGGSGRTAGRRKPAVARGAAALRRTRNNNDE